MVEMAVKVHGEVSCLLTHGVYSFTMYLFQKQVLLGQEGGVRGKEGVVSR